ncbi:ubiquinol-cytochrome C chaperone family protein [Mesorhizobium xinjiangense]|uniref:ubiquinol-cytochrome C chaperone family protein n=1 Tax=Mesorhizobium xinjiangense TaxID=2678685 RepID=UPI0012EED358|nr:ubiquinol-cytochrome C chaperone family protein [Mesorhizobium xinjiangense]
MFKKLFGLGRNANQPIIDALYGDIVAAARQPELYAAWQVPDTPLGRFEMLSLHMFLFLHRVKGEEGQVRDLAQDLTDRFFAEVDDSLRALGIGDMGIPKRMKKLARMFYGRTASYGGAVDAGDVTALGEALRRNVMPESADWPQSEALARYTLEASEALNRQPVEDFLQGRLAFPTASAREEKDI